MAVKPVDPGDDPLGHAPEGDDDGWFDRCYFNFCSPSGDLFVVSGVGHYPVRGVVDGYVCWAGGGRQQNIRMSDIAGAIPLVVSVVEPLRVWRVEFEDAESGMAVHAEWRALGPPQRAEAIAVAHQGHPPTRFEHYYQAGSYAGVLEVGGRRFDLAGWFGQRDRSWGLRRVSDRLGLHVWAGARFSGGTLGLHYNEARDGNVAHCDGFLDRDGKRVRLESLGHDLVVSDDGELESGQLEFWLKGDAEPVPIEVRSGGRGVYMDGAGYGGWHGIVRGEAHVERDAWDLAAVSPRTLGSALVDKLCDFTVAGRQGRGVFELAVSRSSSYRYVARKGERL